MYLDAALLFSRAQAITATADSSNIIDLSVPRDIGIGEPIELEVVAVAAFAGAGTLTISLVSSSLADFSSSATLAASPAYMAAQLGAGAMVFPIKMPLGFGRYLKLVYTVAGGAFSAGQITAGLNLDRQATRNYASGINLTGV